MVIKVLGSGCKKCQRLETRIKDVLRKENIEAQVEKVTDMMEISAYNVLSTPAMVINDKVVSSGKLLENEEISALIKAN
ncbi:MAG: thioredoxin family protein [Candidatus Izemoplasmatales bacterium]|uniref:Thioredoxin family protein n=1 Tax=Hujiaoplasma nucleasis TaxID=2725268 RepID=A0A7L6N7K1_9MOLU|nr:thioredoxin family protein [Hujiaoplasma nucleasis]QLY40519.1 thioredoxin family protein [Hujiaoplasma nucleasis]